MTKKRGESKRQGTFHHEGPRGRRKEKTIQSNGFSGNPAEAGPDTGPVREGLGDERPYLYGLFVLLALLALFLLSNHYIKCYSDPIGWDRHDSVMVPE